MDARLDRLDLKVDGLAKETATLTERISHLPSKEWVDDRLGRQLRNLSLIVGLIVAIATVISIFAKP